jgi:hypothetical protein
MEFASEVAKRYAALNTKENKINRVEVIEHYKGGQGRNYVNWNDSNKVELSYQDGGRTLKIFITRAEG